MERRIVIKCVASVIRKRRGEEEGCFIVRSTKETLVGRGGGGGMSLLDNAQDKEPLVCISQHI